MIAKGTVINHARCICCRNLEGQKKVIDTFFEGMDVVIVFKCFACDGLIKVNYKPYLHRPFNGKGFTVSEQTQIDIKGDIEPFYGGIFDKEGPNEVKENKEPYRGFRGLFDKE